MPRKKASLDIVFVLDMTGSMQSVKAQAIDGYNEYVTGMQKSDPGAAIALTTFNSAEIKNYPVTPIKDAMLLNEDNYQPNSTTPLYDAIGGAVAATDKRVKKGGKVAFVILTDGLENASKEYTRDGIFRLLKEREQAGWGIIYLGANQDAYKEAMGMGIDQSNVANYAASQIALAIGKGALGSSQLYARTGQTKGLTDSLDKDSLVKDSPPNAGDPMRPPKKKRKGK